MHAAAICCIWPRRLLRELGQAHSSLGESGDLEVHDFVALLLAEGFVIADCDFPGAWGFGLLRDVEFRIFATSIPVEVLP